MKIVLSQINLIIGDFNGNLQKIISNCQEAIESKSDLIVFPELAICGYPAWDFLEFDDFIEICQFSIEKLFPISKQIGIIIGSPSINPNAEGKNLYNSAYFLFEGKIQAIIHKFLLPTYDIFDEYRYFEPATQTNCILFKGKKIALTICEDLWNLDNDPLYTSNPMDILIKENPDFAINIAASPFSFSQPFKRLKVLKRNAERYNIPFFYVNFIGAQTELIFDGGSGMVLPNGKSFGISYFEEKLLIIDNEINNENSLEIPSKYHLVFSALTSGIKDYFQKLGLQKATLGLSGGIDSAVVYVLAGKALGFENVLPILLPSPYTTSDSNDLAIELVKNAKGKYETLKIEGIMNTIDSELSFLFKGTEKGLTEENIQARIRGLLLMAVSNKFGNILLNTSNKSEMAVGYSTLYGDSNGAISVMGDLYKTEVFELANFINENFDNIIPEKIISRPPSAELRPDQKDSDSLPDYPILDKILIEYIENRKSPSEIIEMGLDYQLVHRILKLVNKNEFKRFQAPPVLRVSTKAFGVGRRLPIVAKYLD